MDNLCTLRSSRQPGFSEKSGSIITGADANDRIDRQLLSLSESIHDVIDKLDFVLGSAPRGDKGQVLSISQQLEQMKREIFARMDSEMLDEERQDKAQPLDKEGTDPFAAVEAHTEYLKRIEGNVKTLVGASMKTPQETEALKDQVSNMHQSSQTVVTEELKMHRETLKLITLQQDELLLEFKQLSHVPTPCRDDRGMEASHGQYVANGIAPDFSSDPFNGLVPSSPFPSESKVKQDLIAGAVNEEEMEKQEILELEIEEACEEAEDEDEEVHHETMTLREGGGMGDVFSVDNELERPSYHVEDFYKKRGCCQAIARSNAFANFTVLVVMFNAVYIGFDSDYNTAQNIYSAGIPFQACSQFFCVYFTFELVVRVLAFEKKRNCMKDGWFKFDAFLVSTMILDTWVLMPTLFFVGGSVTIPTQPLRMLRLFKLTRMARLMKAFPELVTMIKGLVRSLRAISSSMILVGLMVYVWAIMMHMLMKEEQEFNDRLWTEMQLGFETMTTCIWTLLVSGTLMLDNASPLMSYLLFSDQFHYVLAGLAFVSYSMMSAMCILQMLIGVLCDVVSTVKAEENSANAIGLMKQEILVYLKDCDSSGDGKISQEELAKVMKAPRSRALLRKLRIHYPFFLQLQKTAFKRPNRPVPIRQVLELMVMSRGDNVATVESMAGALTSIIDELASVKENFSAMGSRLDGEIEAVKRCSVGGMPRASTLEYDDSTQDCV